MKKIKLLSLLFIIAAFIYVFINSGRVYTMPLQKTVDLSGRISYFSRTDKWMAVISERMLYIADSSGSIQKIVNLEKDKIFNYDSYDVAIDDDFFIVYGTDHYENTSYFSSEKLARISASGKLEDYIFEKDHPESERFTFVEELDILGRDGFVYWLNDDGKCISLLKIPVHGSGSDVQAETVAEFNVPEEASDGYYDIDHQQIYIQLISGGIYSYDLRSGILQKADVLELPAAVDAEEVPQSFSLSTGYFIWSNLYYFSLLLLGLGVLSVFILFIRSRSFAESKKTWIFVLFLIVAVATLTNQIVVLKQDAAYHKLSTVADMAIFDIQKKFSGGNAFSDFVGCQEQPEINSDITWCREYLDSICRLEGSEIPLYMISYAVNDAGQAFFLTSTDHDVYIGKESDTLDDIPEETIKQKSSGRAYDYHDKSGLIHIEERYLYDTNGNLSLILEVGGDSSSIYNDSISQALTVILSLAALLAVLWVVFDCYGKFKTDISEYLKAKERRSIQIRLKLSGIYFFIVNILIHLDYFLLVMVTAYICDEHDAIKLAAMMIIPVTSYRVGTWSGSVIVSTLVSKLGERKSGLLSAAISAASYGMMAFACMIRNIYLLAFAKLLEGIFLESVLYSLAEGLPYELDDETDKASWISRVHDCGDGAVIIGLMAAGWMAEYVGYAWMYLIGVAGSAILFILGTMMLRTPDEEVAEEEEETASPGNSWFAFLRPKVLIYLVMVVVVYALFAGYEDYIFPIFSESCNISDTMLSNMGVLANLAAFVGIESILPKKKQSPLMLITGAFGICGFAICLMYLHPSLTYAFIVLLINNFVGRILEDYKALELTKITDQYGYDVKEVQENYYAVEDGTKILQAPVLGTLCNISASVCCLVLGLLCIILPGSYAWIRKNNLITHRSQNEQT